MRGCFRAFRRDACPTRRSLLFIFTFSPFYFRRPFTFRSIFRSTFFVSSSPSYFSVPAFLLLFLPFIYFSLFFVPSSPFPSTFSSLAPPRFSFIYFPLSHLPLTFSFHFHSIFPFSSAFYFLKLNFLNNLFKKGLRRPGPYGREKRAFCVIGVILVKTHSVIGPKSPSRRPLRYPLASKESRPKRQGVVECRAFFYKAPPEKSLFCEDTENGQKSIIPLLRSELFGSVEGCPARKIRRLEPRRARISRDTSLRQHFLALEK